MNTGEAAKQAIGFLRIFYQDVYSFMMECEQQLNRRGWTPPKSSRIGTLSNSLDDPRRWVLDALFRCYLKTGTGETKEAVILLLLFHTSYFEDARCLAVKAQFDRSITHEEIWNHWRDARELLTHLTANPNSNDLPKDTFSEHSLPDATSAQGYLIPLHDLTDAASVKVKLIDVLLGNEAPTKK